MTMLSPCMLTATGPGIFKTLKNTQSVDFITHGLIFRDYMVLLRPVYSHHHPWAYFQRLHGAPQTCILPSSPMGLFSEITWCSSDLYTPIITHGLIFRDYMVLLRPVYSHRHPWAYFRRLYGAPQTCILPSSPMGLFSEIIWCSSDLYTPTPLTFSSSLTSYPRHVGAELKITVHMIGLNVRAHGPGLLSLIS